MHMPVVTRVGTIIIGALAILLSAAPVRAQGTDPVVRQGAPVKGSAPSVPAAPAVPVARDDNAGTTDANANAAAVAREQTRKIIADKAANDAAREQTIADNDARMEDYRRRVRETEAKNAEIRRRNEARVALYKACVAGDKAACQQYNAGQ